MARVVVDDAYLTAIANAIRDKLETDDTYKPSEMAEAIESISGGGSATLGTKTITENGTYDPEDDDLDGYSEVTVNVPSSSGSQYEDFSGGNIQAIISHGTEYILTDYLGSLKGLYSIKFADSNVTGYEGYWAMANGTKVVGVQRYASQSKLTIKFQAQTGTNFGWPGYADGDPITITYSTVDLTDTTATLPLVIGGSYYNSNLESTKATFAFYGLNVFDSDGDVIKRFRPWLENGVACVKELESSTIYYNTGTGTYDYIDLEGVTHSGS